MDRITQFEEALKASLLRIGGVGNETTPSGQYTYYNDVTVVNIEDEPLAKALGDFPVINIKQDLDYGEEILSGNSRAYECAVRYNLRCGVSNDFSDITPTTRPRYAINVKMNELLEDVKAMVGYNSQLDETCNICSIKRSKRVYLEDGNQFRAGDIYIKIEVQYSQSRLNPTKNCTY